MKKLLAISTLLLVVLSFCTACSATYQDGVYHAEFASFDDHGWKEYVDVEVSGGTVTVLTFDGINAEGALKSQDATYRSNMESVEGTYPSKFYADITNQYLDSGKLKEVATVAGATVSTDNFKVLMSALDEPMKNGDTTSLVVEPTGAAKTK